MPEESIKLEAGHVVIYAYVTLDGCPLALQGQGDARELVGCSRREQGQPASTRKELGMSNAKSKVQKNFWLLLCVNIIVSLRKSFR